MECAELLLQVSQLCLPRREGYSKTRTFTRMRYRVVSLPRCGNVASILQLDEHLEQDYKVFDAAPQESRSIPAKATTLHYFL